MALCASIISRRLLTCNGKQSPNLLQCRAVSLNPRPAQILVEEESHDEKNMRLNRPQSPHLTIYKFQLPAWLSITHRATGMVLSGYAVSFATISLLSNKSMVEIVQNVSHCYPQVFLLFKAGLIFPFTYHFFNGIRHLMWDGGKGLGIKGVYTSGYIMLLAAGTTGLALSCY